MCPLEDAHCQVAFRAVEKLHSQVLTMPLFFASNAIYPISMMPGWLQAVSRANPLTYEVDALRALMLAGGTSVNGLGLDFGIMVAATVALVVIGGRVYPNVAM